MPTLSFLPSSFRWIRSRKYGCVCRVPSQQQRLRVYKYVCVGGVCVCTVVVPFRTLRVHSSDSRLFYFLFLCVKEMEKVMEEKHSELQGKPVRTGSSHPPWTRRRDPPPPEHSHGQRDTATSPQPTQRTRSEHPPRQPHVEADLTHPPVTRHQNLHSHPAFNGMRCFTR
ncbi:exo-alpha-sialidase [Trypanosoma cruzi]|nr:exo-alpha-sialidase [Trypanosoma cruzi]